MSKNQHQHRIDLNGQHESLSSALSQHRYPSLFISCCDPVMEQALTSFSGLSSSLIIRPLRCSAQGGSLIDNVSLDLIETAVRRRRIVQIIVCGHAYCSLYLKPTIQQNSCGKSSFEKLVTGVCQREESNRQGRELVVERMRKLQQSPLLASALSKNELTIHGLFYLAESGMFTVFNYPSGQFVPAVF